MVNFTSLRSVAERLIDENGRDVTITKRDRTDDDPAKPWRGPPSPGTDVSVTVKAVLFDFDEADVDGQLVRRGDKRALVAAKVVEEANATSILEEFDTLTDGSIKLKVVSVTIIEPGPLRILYDVQLRR